MALALWDRLEPFFAAYLGQISHLGNLLRSGIEAEHLGALFDFVRAQDVVDFSIAPGSHRVIAVVTKRKARVVGLSFDLLARISVAIRHI
ncbi:hypothetical protein SDC9_150309 [bioreactor metagenome]|uniref:Uncharacterized protein n=1 Tax=bioreactor metagenome TaxID=1076179 RepID=A0A645ENR5_9ZZZZ